MFVASAVLEKAEQWSNNDPNPTTRKYVKNLLERAQMEEAASEIKSLFPDDNCRISFGTAGLRSKMKPGPLGMNDLTVIQAAQGLARYCLKENPNAKKLCAVVGYDHRENNDSMLSSLSFALFTVLVFEEAGIDVVLLDGYNFTPLVPFVLQKTGAVVGVMITASHNPKADNGYKVYASDGCQIRAPMDKDIAIEIDNNLRPWKDYGTILESRRQTHEGVCLGLSNPELTRTMIDAYFDAITTSGLKTGQGKLKQSANSLEPPSIAYTAMHGVGYTFAAKVFEAFDLPPFQAVPSQKDPDATFPTVPFPNPEEKGALDLAKSFAEANGCDIVLANDPDADRLAVAERDRATGEWTLFHGDQIGAMLGLWIWEKIGKTCGEVRVIPQRCNEKSCP
jgi:phosphoglucomutase